MHKIQLSDLTLYIYIYCILDAGALFSVIHLFT